MPHPQSLNRLLNEVGGGVGVCKQKTLRKIVNSCSRFAKQDVCDIRFCYRNYTANEWAPSFCMTAHKIQQSADWLKMYICITLKKYR